MILTKAQKRFDYNYIQNKSSNVNNHKRNFWIIFVFGIILILIGLILMVYIGQSVKITHLNYRLNELQQKSKQIEEENRQLNLQLAQNSSLARIEEIARHKLNMIEPEKIEVIVLNNNQQELKLKLNKDNQEKIFLLKVFDDIFAKMGTVKAGEVD